MRVALVGCGEHAFRNILPALNYLPVDLVATCDVDLGRAEAYARSFGAERSFGSFDELLRWSSSAGLEAVLLVLGMRNGLPQYSDFVIPALEKGLHVWMEKPAASTVGEVEAMLAAQERSGKTVQVGYKHYFFPALVKAKEFIDSPEFGGALSIGASYPLVISPAESRSDPAKAPVDLNICHPGAAIHLLMGDIESVWFDRAPNGGGV
ncbi:MAG TPA: Gfo/Idh/MocA family oxidoreductase, partial [Candidatus Limnocylindria bacterium]|nr:Gfo/Idh/MocA family oxidoreductase [Candidatus Limnocylindria bacterium]